MKNRTSLNTSQQEIESKPEEHLAYNMGILKEMVSKCDYLYAQKIADTSRWLERDFAKRSISLALYQHSQTEIERQITKFGEECSCLKATNLRNLEKT